METKDPYVELLEYLTKYDSLLEQLKVTFSDGFQHLSRANYSNKDALRGRYGKDYWDHTYEGIQFVSLHDDKIEIVAENRKETEDLEKTIETGEEDNKLRRRKDNQEQQKAPEKKKQQKLTDPIYMFGGLLSIPSSLRQCQSSFKGSMPLITDLVNCRKDIDRLLEKLQNEREKY